MIEGFFAVDNKCAVDLSSWHLPISEQEVLGLLWKKGFRVVEVDLVTKARNCIGHSRYRRGAHISIAPFVMDCSTLTKWLYGSAGIWLPRHSVDQAQMGKFVQLNQVEAGDLLFTAGRKPYFHNPSALIGHVGIATNEGTVIHAANSKLGIVEEEITSFVGAKFTTARRIKDARVITLECPTNLLVEWSGQLRNLILQYL